MVQRKYHVEWSIYSDANSEDVDDWIEATNVGYDAGNGCGIPQLTDGIYKVKQRIYWDQGEYKPDAGYAALNTKVTVSDGKISKNDCLNAVDEFITLTGDHHYFIESITHDKESNTLSFHLGS